jgi:hypothetical protein
MINRAAVILKCKDALIRWVNASDPHDDNPGVTLRDANEDRTVYLIREDDAEKIEEWIALHFKVPFESELEGWYTDESLWPQNIDRKLFEEWFEVECHTVLADTVGDKITDDEK